MSDTTRRRTCRSYLARTGEVVPLTPNLPGRNFLEAWSRDGTRIVFTNEYNDNTDVYSVKLDGTGLTRVTKDPRHDLVPRWSPDGRRIVFYRLMTLAGTSALHVVNADGTNERLVLDTLFHDLDPARAPDGSRIVFSCDRFGRPASWDVCSVAPDGSGLRRIASVGDALLSQWSPDGSRVAYRSLGNGRIWVAKLDGSPPVNLTPPVASYEFDWSPVGTRLLLSVSDGTYGLATVDRDGANYARLPVTIVSGYANWSPDGTKLVADVMLAGRRVVAVMNPDGSGVRVLEPVGNVAAYRALASSQPVSPTAASATTMTKAKRKATSPRRAPRRRADAADDMLPHYDFHGGVRGKYAARYREGTNVVVLAPDVGARFPDAASVNRALRALAEVADGHEGKAAFAAPHRLTFVGAAERSELNLMR